MGDYSIYLFVALLAVFGGAVLLQVLWESFASRRRICPECGKKSLRCVQWVRISVLVEGKKTPESTSYFQCDSCNARLKKSRDASFTVPSELEWRKYCSAKW
jgi:predicted RNA-binding Zn-ribbon protein involved in translation (DUF1610 family)